MEQVCLMPRNALENANANHVSITLRVPVSARFGFPSFQSDFFMALDKYTFMSAREQAHAFVRRVTSQRDAANSANYWAKFC